jgi:predicted nucleotidyltransferase
MKKKPVNLETDFVDFVRLCNIHTVKYLVIGGYAVSIHGYPRSTKDLDICIELSENNAEKMVRVINDFGFGSLRLAKDDFLKKDWITQLGHEPVRIDILNDLDGVSFSEAWENKKVVNYEGEPIPFIGYHDLLKVKAKAGRPQDLADINKLEKRNKKK